MLAFGAFGRSFGATEFDVDVRVRNVGGGPTTVTEVALAGVDPIGQKSIWDFFAQKEPLKQSLIEFSSRSVTMVDPPGPKHSLRPAPLLSPKTLVDFRVRLRIGAAAEDLLALRDVVRRQTNLVVLVVRDIEDTAVSIVLWDCAAPKKPTACTGALFALR